MNFYLFKSLLKYVNYYENALSINFWTEHKAIEVLYRHLLTVLLTKFKQLLIIWYGIDHLLKIFYMTALGSNHFKTTMLVLIAYGIKSITDKKLHLIIYP